MYYPSNKIKTDLYTNGKEYRKINEKLGYVGSYYSTFTGDKYTGKNPNDGPNIFLVPLEEEKPNLDPISTPSYKYFLPTEYNPTIYAYTRIKNINTKKITYYPYQEFPTPTEEDYKIGEFQRYFVIKSNENVFFELKKEQYNKYKTQDKEVDYENYNPFQLNWKLTGTKEQVYQTNQKMTVLKEKKIKRIGLQQFLKENYLKFYKEA